MRSAEQSHLLPERAMQYRAPRRHHLSAIGHRSLILVAILIGVTCAGCSMSRDSVFSSLTDGQEVTGSISQTADKGPSESDLAFARAAASDVLTRGSKDSSQPWENPATGARGSVTPIASAYTAEGRTCRDFLASFVHGQSESWLQGAACRSERGHWDIHSMRAWKQG